MDINGIVSLIPENSADEALLSVETITVFPTTESAKIKCHLSHVFNVEVKCVGESVYVSTENWPTSACNEKTFVSTLRRVIYEIDSAIEAGKYKPPVLKPNVIHQPEPPKNMDIPIWDEKTGRWYDAEY
ncbi:TPA: hypothetical protein SMW11_003320 [Pseudomonas aeruginosa]|nr:hypothetical protein [Pseudomonas aeruginosa]